MPLQKNILVLYTELAYYTVRCFSELASTHNVNIHILRLPVSKSAPFEFGEADNRIKFHNANEFDLITLNKLYNDIKPSLIYCAGWTNQLYLKFCKSKHKECKTLLGFDTKWQGNIRQILGTVYAKFTITPYFTYAFVPGKLQAQLAKNMGFKSEQIAEKAYSADVDFFKTIYDSKTYTEKVVIFVGRYVKEKGIEDLCKIFIDLKSKKELKDWKLWCIGKGPIQIPKHPDIFDYGFRQPHQLFELMKGASVFVLPSTFEPWGLVVHEFASAGFPLICSDEIGSNEFFVRDGKNGFVFKAGDKKELAECIQKMCNLNADTLKQMGTLSYELAHQITPQIWADSFYKLL